MTQPLRIATRKSELALAQAREVAIRLEAIGVATELVPVESAAVKPGGVGSSSAQSGMLDKSRFVSGVETALLEGRADIGVHSAKDLPGSETAGLRLAGTLPRAAAADAWVANLTRPHARSLDDVPTGARVGTASVRRRSQLLAVRPDLVVEELRGNVDTRIRLIADLDLDAAVLAEAGLERLGRQDEIGFRFPAEVMLPAAGQGALALQVTDGGDAGATAAAEAVAGITDRDAMATLIAERALIIGLSADCDSPVAASARISGEDLQLEGYVGRADGSEWIRDGLTGPVAEAEAIGTRLARRMVDAGADEVLDR